MTRRLDDRGRTSVATPPDRTEPSWRNMQERGTVVGIKTLVICATMFGRAPARAILYLVALYYTLASSQVRRAVTSFRGRLGVSTGFGATYRTVLRFAQCSLDALFQLRGMTKHFRVERNGHEILGELRETGTSAILLGAHLGSIHAMRSQSRDEALPVVPVVYTKNARRFNRVLEELDPTSTTRLIEIGDGDDMDFMLAIRERAESGALIAILGDRTQPGAKTVDVDFLGAKAQVPAGPYILAATLRLPVYFTVGIYRGGADYEFFCIPFADRIVLPRGKRQEAIAEYAQKYADLLTEFCRKEPDNWFNFFDFWSGQ